MVNDIPKGHRARGWLAGFHDVGVAAAIKMELHHGREVGTQADVAQGVVSRAEDAQAGESSQPGPELRGWGKFKCSAYRFITTIKNNMSTG